MDSWRVATREHPRSSIESELRGSVPPGVKHSGQEIRCSFHAGMSA